MAKTSREEIWFEYDPAWVGSGFALSPFPLFNLRPGAFKPSNPVFDGLHGVFNDALPDGWGRLLMDRAFRQALGWERRQITPLDRLAYIGSRAMLEVSRREPCLDYAELLKAVRLATRDVREVQKAFRLMLFNVLAHNKDDHVKNFSFLFDSKGWTTTPAYDLTFSSGIGNQHTTSIAGSGNPSLQEIRTIAGQLQIDDWEQTVAQMFEAVAQWERFATEQKVPKGVMVEYGKAMRSAPCHTDLAKRPTRTRTTRKPA